MSERITLALKTVRQLWWSDNFGVTSRFYRVTDEDDKIYTISTTHFLAEGDKITASVKGPVEYNGVPQIALNRVKMIEANANAPQRQNRPSSYIGHLISTD